MPVNATRKRELLAKLTTQQLIDAAAQLEGKLDKTDTERITFAWTMSEFCQRIGHELDQPRFAADAKVLGPLDALAQQLPDGLLEESKIDWPTA